MCSPIAGEDGEQPLLKSSRHRRALSLIALSVIVIVATDLACLHPPPISKPKSTELAGASPHASTATSIDYRPIAIRPLTELFRSPKMHYAVNFPVGWTVTPATQSWRGEGDTWGKPNADELGGRAVVFTRTSEPLEPGQSPAKWIAWYLAFAGTNACDAQEYMDFLGLIGLIYLNGCSSTDMPGPIHNAAVVIGGRGYSFSMKGEVDHEFFVSMLRTISFVP